MAQGWKQAGMTNLEVARDIVTYVGPFALFMVMVIVAVRKILRQNENAWSRYRRIVYLVFVTGLCCQQRDAVLFQLIGKPEQST